MEPTNFLQALRSLAAKHRQRLVSHSHIPIAIAELGEMGADAVIDASVIAAQKLRLTLPSLAVDAAVYGVAAATMIAGGIVHVGEAFVEGVRDGLAEFEKDG